MGELAEQMRIAHHSAVGMVDRMEGLGLVKRVSSEHDRRQVQVSVTRKGPIYWKSSIGFVAQNFVPLDRNRLRYSKERHPGLPNEPSESPSVA